jgi:hypothetical protein
MSFGLRASPLTMVRGKVAVDVEGEVLVVGIASGREGSVVLGSEPKCC